MTELEIEIQKTKAAYNDALHNLEKISNEIHKLRQEQAFDSMIFLEHEVSWIFYA